MSSTHVSTVRLLSCDCEMFEMNKITILGSVSTTLATHQKHAWVCSMKLACKNANERQIARHKGKKDRSEEWIFNVQKQDVKKIRN